MDSLASRVFERGSRRRQSTGVTVIETTSDAESAAT